jgi:hypothetical protein
MHIVKKGRSMAEQTYSIDQDLKEAQAMAKALIPYVYEKDLYGRVGGNMPALTIGAVLMRLRRLRTLQSNMNDKQRAQLQEIETRHEQARREWTNAYEGKIVKEALSRLDGMKAFFDECNSEPRSCASAYMPEALKRTIVEEIRMAMRELNIASAEVDSKVRSTDMRLRGFIQQSPFVWASALESVYPSDRFWWLYNRPSSS